MQIAVEDFNAADEFFASPEGAARWKELKGVLRSAPICLQPSGQAGLGSRPIFDPKATNAALTEAAATLGWSPIPVPSGLTEFGTDWDAGKNTTLAEWQFSNYPFLWNNVIRTEAVIETGIELTGMKGVEALVVVTKSGSFPASNSTLYYEQARAQLAAATKFGAFNVPIRLVGFLAPERGPLDVIWSEYPGRYGRVPSTRDLVQMDVEVRKAGKHGNRAVRFTPT